MKTAEDIPVCEKCGCRGNCECGHESLDEKNGCTLDAVMVCPCCNVCMGHEGYGEAIIIDQKRRIIEAVKSLPRDKWGLGVEITARRVYNDIIAVIEEIE